MCTQVSGLYLHNPVTMDETTHMTEGCKTGSRVNT